LRYLIVPSIIATNQNQLNVVLKKVRGFDFEIPNYFEYEAHLMIKQPLKWISKNAQKIQTVIMHIETLKNVPKALDFAKNNDVKIGLAAKIETKLENILPYMNHIDQLLLMTVDPGSYCIGKEFRSEPLDNIKRIRENYPTMPIEVDGCMNPKNAKLARDAGANIFVSGSFILKSDNVTGAINELKEAISVNSP
jgi:ribulose-phosphate 3-epimerase